ncbi:MAG: hypothetical protein AAF763_14945 [Pseudomonadota bacterium]
MVGVEASQALGAALLALAFAAALRAGLVRTRALTDWGGAALGRGGARGGWRSTRWDAAAAGLSLTGWALTFVGHPAGLLAAVVLGAAGGLAALAGPWALRWAVR